MNRDKLINRWLNEERIAHIHGWDFSHIDGRYSEEDHLPWDYAQVIRSYLRPDMRILDIDTGGGEFLRSLGHPNELTSATEGYPPNVRLCRDTLLRAGVDFRAADGKGPLPFDDGTFDLVIDRHGDFCAEEIWRVLKPGGRFITQQVGAENDRELVEMLMPDAPDMPFPEQYLSIARTKFENCGFVIEQAQEAFRPIRFYDIGALVWFARIIEWEFPGFSVNTNREALMNAQETLERNGCVEGRIHRFLLVARK